MIDELKKNAREGFSTIELMVAVALFTATVLMSAAAMTAVVFANQKARSTKVAVDSLHFVFEDMARVLRLGSKYYCQNSHLTPIVINPSVPGLEVRDCRFDPNDANSGGPYLGFRDKNNKITFYRFDGVCIQKKVTNVDWDDGVYVDDLGSGYACVTPAQVTIDRMRFYVINTDAASGGQPFIVIGAKGTAGTRASTQTTFSLLTSISQRIPHNSE